VTTPCASCGKTFTPKAPTARFCSNSCRQKALRDRKAGRPEGGEQVVTLPVTGVATGTVAATLAELTQAGRVDTHLGQAALALATRIDSATAVMGFAALVKELRSTMVEALRGAAREPDIVDELEERRERKFAGA
jgi:hypothetical protein